MSELHAFLQTCSSEEARFESVSRDGGGFVCVFSGQAGKRHTLDFWAKSHERRAFETGRHLAFAYRPSQDAAGHHGIEQRVIAKLLAHEEKLWEALQSFVEPSVVPPIPGRPVFLREMELGARILRRLPRATSLTHAVRAVLDEACASAAQATEVQLYFETACAQACEFCEEPVNRERLHRRAVNRLLVLQHELRLDLVSSGALRAFLDAVAERELPLTITGHDWTRHPHRGELLRILEERAPARLRLQGPSLALDSMAFARRIAALPGLEWIATTIQSAEPDEHDAMVGARGAHARLIPALENLTHLGVRVSLTLVLTRRALRTLPVTLELLQRRRWFVGLAAFVPDRALGDVRDELAPLDELRVALDRALPVAREVVRSLVGVPPCAVPEALRDKVAPVLRTSEREPLQFGSRCRACGSFSLCSGVPAGYVRALGTRGMEPLTSR
jgi:hypothetical protein